MVESRLNKPLAIGAIIVALILGVLLGMTSGVVDRIFGGPNPKTIASASLESMRAQNRLIAFVARYVSVTTSTTSRFGFDAKRTLILPGDVRYELDLSKLQPEDVTWDASSHTLRVQLPEVELAGPEVDLSAAQEYGESGVLSSLTNADQQLDQANRAKAVSDLRKQASGAVPMRLAREAARQAVQRSFAMPLLAAGFKDAKVVAKFPTEGTDETSYLDVSTPYNEAIAEAERRRAQDSR
ncbi:DUF4230 domain-containing protein [Sphingomonas sp. SM33]|uniref:DUF4230 domain-containing protein n=1 Tax=Sphingomonas telluris TaxID=2907998 RepID=A0ABS9VJW0_9SPHN|nr:DUF4230 domain-containing protein [Sphingomonas telluris]MCH8614829.1 DUF4230 domain-containing protein [Sphingomonas telluris]